ncbi:MAG: AraC family transcriptional regulator [Pseudomonadota bacterium]
MRLAEIAYACGFASQSHMTDVFREKLGVTPGRYRKEVRS